ncbi:hypothetical protein [Halopiger aswanensis]|uniref:Uncharacterized protein n=1 Tax=Halopiger aswanensis TaxID=148449 RepID=A0A419WEQ2_9EURY|nr:hypothetical protein [Halopiger aswanensis]RKD93960.1 hypothetical protein ATJ93_3595 [Halopiger aswanensis]
MTHQPPQRQPHERSEYEAMNEQSGQMQQGGGAQMTGTQPGARSERQPGMQSGTQQMRTTGTSGQSSQMEPGMQETGGQIGSQGMQPQSQPQMQIQQQPQAQTQMQPQTGGARSFEDHLTNELRIALEDFTELSHVAGWCAKECAGMGPQMQTCARICQDIAEIAELNEKMLARDSMFGPELAETFIRVATEGLPEIRQYSQQHSHIAETVATIERTMNSCETVLRIVGQQGQLEPMTRQERMGQQGQHGQMTQM